MSRIHGSTGTRRGLGALGALTAAGLLLATPDAARAGDEFEDGFKDELGRVAAHEAVGVGRGILAQVLLGGHPGYYGGGYPSYPIHGRGYDDDDRGDWGYHHQQHDGYNRRHYRPYSGHGHHGGGWGHHRRHHRPRYHYQRHRHHHGCDH